MKHLAVLAALAVGVTLATPAHGLRLDPRPSSSWTTVDRMAAICSDPRRLEARLDQLNQAQSADADIVREVLDFCQGHAEKPPTKAQWTTAGQIAFPQGLGVRSTGGLPAIQLGGASWQTAVLEGLTALITERAKAELTMAFIEGLEKNLCREDAIKAWFPDTCTVLGAQTGDAGGQALPVFGGLLRAAVTNDLGGWPEVLANDKCGKALFAAAGVAVGRLVSDGHDPVATLAALGHADYGACGGLGGLADDLKRLGHAVERLAPSHGTSRPSARIFQGLATELGHPVDALIALYDRLRAVRALVAEVQAAPDDAGTFRRYGDAVLDVLIMALRTPPAGASKTTGGAATATAQSASADAAPDRVTAREMLGRIQSMLHAIRVGDYGQLVVDVMRLAPMLDAELPEQVTRYAGFAADMASARTKEDVTHALESAAVPIGTWKRKRRDGVVTVLINSYMGIGGGVELLGGDRAPDAAKGHVGLSVPVGVEISRGFGGWSIGGMVSIIDVGTIASFRLGETKQEGDAAAVATTPSWTFEQVLAPGLHCVIGLTGVVPLSLGVGVSLSPGLREGTFTTAADDGTDSAAKSALNALRAGAFLAVDVPLFEL